MLAPSIFGENFLDDFFGFPEMRDFDDMEKKLYGRKASRVIKTDVREKDDAYEVIVDLPGFKKEDIEVELENGYLTINATKGLDKEENDKKGKLIRQERYSGSMTRSFYVGDRVQKEDVSASYKHGVLTLSVPKQETYKEEVPQRNLIAIEG
ncbi:MAG: Hsp20/alpha crystallin family protein [Lachnospiraceae bacterium]|nr:Hsp20/alpha crystallin family protein [Lachnospiraceae bacterium]